MKKLMGMAVAVAVFAGCGNSTTRGVDEGDNSPAVQPPGDTAVVQPPAGNESPAVTPAPENPDNAQQGLAVELRMRGIEADKYTSLMLVANRVEVIADGKSLDVTPTWRAINLANKEHAEKVATFVLPENVNVVKYRISLGAAGGFESARASGWVDTRSRVLEFETTGAELTRHGRNVVEINAAKSFVARDRSTLAFVPNFRVY